MNVVEDIQKVSNVKGSLNLSMYPAYLLHIASRSMSYAECLTYPANMMESAAGNEVLIKADPESQS